RVQTTVFPQVIEALRTFEQERIALLVKNGVNGRCLRRRSNGGQTIVRSHVVDVQDRVGQLTGFDFSLSAKQNEFFIAKNAKRCGLIRRTGYCADVGNVRRDSESRSRGPRHDLRRTSITSLNAILN